MGGIRRGRETAVHDSGPRGRSGCAALAGELNSHIGRCGCVLSARIRGITRNKIRPITRYRSEPRPSLQNRFKKDAASTRKCWRVLRSREQLQAGSSRRMEQRSRRQGRISAGWEGELPPSVFFMLAPAGPPRPIEFRYRHHKRWPHPVRFVNSLQGTRAAYQPQVSAELRLDDCSLTAGSQRG
jgi:hypothetical protein